MTAKGLLSIMIAIRLIDIERDVIELERQVEAKGKGVRVRG
jgi:hypothetical protein